MAAPPLRPLVSTRAHTAVLVRPISAAVIAVTLLGIVVAALRMVAQRGVVVDAAAAASGMIAMLAVVRLVWRVWEWDRTLLVVNERQLVVRHHGLRRHEQIVPLSGVARLWVHRSIAGRLLGYGTIEIATGRRLSRLRFVPRPDEVSDIITAYAGAWHEPII